MKDRGRLEQRLSEIHDERLAKLDGFEHGIDSALIRKAINRLGHEEERLRGEPTRLSTNPEDETRLASVRRLKELEPELAAALIEGLDELRRRVISRLV